MCSQHGGGIEVTATVKKEISELKYVPTYFVCTPGMDWIQFVIFESAIIEKTRSSRQAGRQVALQNI